MNSLVIRHFAITHLSRFRTVASTSTASACWWFSFLCIQAFLTPLVLEFDRAYIMCFKMIIGRHHCTKEIYDCFSKSEAF